jgi:dihydroneopterin aldolase
MLAERKEPDDALDEPKAVCMATARGTVTLFIDDLVTSARIGIYPAELKHPQKVRLDITVRVANCSYPYTALNVLDYNVLRNGVHAIIAAGHIDYQETLCERVIAMCLSFPRVAMARVRVAKLEAFPDCHAVGCEMERSRGDKVSKA